MTFEGMSASIQWPQRLTTRRLVVRPFMTADHDAWLEGFAPDSPSGGAASVAVATGAPRVWFRALCARHRQLWRRDRVYILGIFDKHSGCHYGHLDIAIHERGTRQWANLGYAVHSHWQRKGIATEACRAAIPWAFSKLGLHRLEVVITLSNKASIALAKKLGLEKECIRRSFEFDSGGWKDQVVYVAIKGRWKLKPA